MIGSSNPGVTPHAPAALPQAGSSHVNDSLAPGDSKSCRNSTATR